MILDQNYSKNQKKLTISYINDDGLKSFLEFNISRFKTYYHTPSGKYTDWGGARCDEKWTDSPSQFDIMNYIYNLDDKYKKLLSNKTFPRMYSWDIETKYTPGEKVNAIAAKNEITTISICSPELVCLVLGTKPLTDEEKGELSRKYQEYLDNVPLFKKLKKINPKIEYKQFNNEISMIEYFLKNVVAKVPILAGWNSDNFDWQYLSNRIKNYYPDTSLRMASAKYGLYGAAIYDYQKNRINIQKPLHTLLVDMMDVIMEHDKVVLDIKESSSLDWISEASLGVKKIEYTGSLEQLYNKDFFLYVFYNAVDSLLVQLIDKRFKTMNIIYNYSTYCTIPIGKCFSKIATSEALVLRDFHDNNIKVVWEEHNKTRGNLPGAYVAIPIKGKHEWVSCNDFSGLYPATIITCNLSFDNFMHPQYYYKNPNKMVWDEVDLDRFRKDPKYFVSVNNNVYKNDKIYTFARVQKNLKAERNITKYMSKSLNAQLLSLLDKEIEKRGLKK